MTRRSVCFGALALVPGGALLGASAEAEAQAAAEAWLALVDKADYGESWERASAMFREKVPKEKWVAAAGSVRGPMGAFRSRQFLGAKYTKELPGVPDGEYVVIQYKAVYANKANAVETVTPAKDEDDVWRVSGYYVR